MDNIVNKAKKGIMREVFVKSIKDVSFSKSGTKCYEVEWESSWEAESELLTFCKDFIQDFWERKVNKLKFSKQKSEEIGNKEKPQENRKEKEQVKLHNSTASTAQQQQACSTALPAQYQNICFVKSVRDEFAIETPQNDITEIPVPSKRKKSSINSKISRRKKFREHLKSHKNGTRLKCDLCDETLSDKKSLTRHQIVIHGKHSPYKCNQCNKMFHKPGDVKRHQVSHSIIRAHACAYCDQSYKTNGNLRRHMASKHYMELCEKNNAILNSSNISSTDNKNIIEDGIMDMSYNDQQDNDYDDDDDESSDDSDNDSDSFVDNPDS